MTRIAKLLSWIPIHTNSIAYVLLGVAAITGRPGFLVGSIILLVFRSFTVNRKILKIEYQYILLSSLLFLIPLVWIIGSKATFSSLEKYVAALVLPYLFFKSKDNEENVKQLSEIFCLIVIAVYLLSIIVALFKYFFVIHLWNLPEEYFFYSDLSNGFAGSHPTYLALSGLFASILIEKIKWPRYIIMLCIVFITCFIILLNARIIVLLQISLISIVYGSQLIRTKIAFHSYAKVILFICCAIAFLFIVTTIQKKPNRSYLFDIRQSFELSKTPSINMTDNGITVRMAIWRNALELIDEKLFFGYGTGSERKILNGKYIESGYKYLAEESLTAHNQLIAWLLEFGLLGTIILFVSTYAKWTLIECLRFKRYMFFLFVILLACMTESILSRVHGVLLVILFDMILFLENE